MSKELVFGFVGALLILITFVIAVRAIFNGKFKPHRVTYGIFVLLNVVVLFNQIINGGGYSVYFIAVGFFGVTTVFLLSFKMGMGGSSLLDRSALIGALLLTIYWIVSQDSRYSTLIAVAIDFVALIPTLVKSYKHPGTEIYLNWVMGGLGALLSVFAIDQADWVLFVFPIYIFLGNFLVVLAKFLGSKRMRNSESATT